MTNWSRAVAFKLEVGAGGLVRSWIAGFPPRVSKSLRSEPREICVSEKQVAPAGLLTTR